jgi:hypothetical protein
MNRKQEAFPRSHEEKKLWRKRLIYLWWMTMQDWP